MHGENNSVTPARTDCARVGEYADGTPAWHEFVGAPAPQRELIWAALSAERARRREVPPERRLRATDVALSIDEAGALTADAGAGMNVPGAGKSAMVDLVRAAVLAGRVECVDQRAGLARKVAWRQFASVGDFSALDAPASQVSKAELSILTAHRSHRRPAPRWAREVQCAAGGIFGGSLLAALVVRGADGHANPALSAALIVVGTLALLALAVAGRPTARKSC